MVLRGNVISWIRSHNSFLRFATAPSHRPSAEGGGRVLAQAELITRSISRGAVLKFRLTVSVPDAGQPRAWRSSCRPETPADQRPSRTAPSQRRKISERESTFFPSACSGDMYGVVPITDALFRMRPHRLSSSGIIGLFRLIELSQAKIENLYDAFVAYNNIARLHIAVNDARPA